MVKMYSLSLTLCRCVATLREAFFGAPFGAHFFNKQKGGMVLPSTIKESNEVKMIAPEDLSSALDSVALAYENYPMFNYLVGKPSKATSIKQIILSSILASKIDYIGLSVGDNNKAVAIFIKPNYKGAPALPFLFKGGLKLIFKHSLGIVFRLLNYENNAMKIKGKYSDNDCWYLYSLTVHPDYQCKGLASKVMKPMLDFFDTTGQSCYLETNKDCNVPMYEHFGFKLMETGFIPNTDVVHYAMRRDPIKNKDE